MQDNDTPDLRREFVERFGPFIPLGEVLRHSDYMEDTIHMVQNYAEHIHRTFGDRVDLDGVFADMDRWLADRGYVTPNHS